MPVTFGSFTGRGLGKSGEKVVTVPKIQPTTTKMILVAGGGAAGPGTRNSGYPPHPWWAMIDGTNNFANTAAFQQMGDYFEDIADGFNNSTLQPTWTTASGSYSPIYSSGVFGGFGSGGGGSGEVKYSNIANVYHSVTYSVVIGTGGAYSDTGPDGRGASGSATTLNAPAPGVPGGLSVSAAGGGGGGGGGTNPMFKNYNNYPPATVNQGFLYHRTGADGGSGGGAGGGRFEFSNSISRIGVLGSYMQIGGNSGYGTTTQTSTGSFIGVGGVGGNGFNAPPSLMAGGGGGASGRGGREGAQGDDTSFGSKSSIYTPVEVGGSLTADHNAQLANTAYISNVAYNLGWHGNGAGAQHFTGTHPITKTYGAYNMISADGVHGTGLFNYGSVPSNFNTTPYLYAGCEPGNGGDGFAINFCFNYYSRVGSGFGTEINWASPPNIISGGPAGISVDNARVMPAVSPSNAPYHPFPIGQHGQLEGVIAGGGAGCSERFPTSAKNWIAADSSPQTTTFLHYPSTPGTTYTKGSAPGTADNGLGARAGTIANSDKNPGSGGAHDEGDGIPNASGMDGVFLMQHSNANAVATCTGSPVIFESDGNIYYIFKSSGTFNWANTIPE